LTEKKKSRDYYTKRRLRDLERQEDDQDKMRELQEEDMRRREETRREEELRRLRETANVVPRAHEAEHREPKPASSHHHHPPAVPVRPPPPPLPQRSPLRTSPFSPSSPTTPTESSLKSGKVSGFMLGGNTLEKKKPVVAVVPAFTDEPEVDELYLKKKRKLVTLDTAMHEEVTDKKQKIERIKNVIDTIPTEKELLFQYAVDWDVIEKNGLLEKRMRSWICKRIIEYLGEEEKTLIDFIINKLSTRIAPDDLLHQLVLVLDEEAESFVIKMWRMLIFEILSAQ